jgi:hypothetical protein
MHFRRAVVVALLTVPGVAAAQKKDTLSTVEAQAQRARRGAGIQIGTWAMIDDPASGSSSTSDSPIGEGFFRKGLDKHIALETTAGIWRRVITQPATGGPLGSPGGTTTAILIPQMTSIKLYPFTSPSDAFEPFISAGGGITIGIQNESGSGGLTGGSGGVSAILPAIGVGAAAGFEWRFSQAFGLSASGNYSYIHFFEDLAGEHLYRGTGVRVGMTYRFQY